MGRKRHSECLPLSVWCFWLWSNASQLPISRQTFFWGDFPLARDPGVSGIDSHKRWAAPTGFALERLRDAKRVYEKTASGRARDASQELHHAEWAGAPQ